MTGTTHTNIEHITDTKRAGRKPFDINYRTIVAFRENGKGHNVIESVCGFMNLPPPMNNSAYRKIMKELYPSYKRMAQENMNEVATSIRKSKTWGGFF